MASHGTSDRKLRHILAMQKITWCARADETHRHCTLNLESKIDALSQNHSSTAKDNQILALTFAFPVIVSTCWARISPWEVLLTVRFQLVHQSESRCCLLFLRVRHGQSFLLLWIDIRDQVLDLGGLFRRSVTSRRFFGHLHAVLAKQQTHSIAAVFVSSGLAVRTNFRRDLLINLLSLSRRCQEGLRDMVAFRGAISGSTVFKQRCRFLGSTTNTQHLFPSFTLGRERAYPCYKTRKKTSWRPRGPSLLSSRGVS